MIVSSYVFQIPSKDQQQYKNNHEPISPLSVIYLPKKSHHSLTQFLTVHALKEMRNSNTIHIC